MYISGDRSRRRHTNAQLAGKLWGDLDGLMNRADGKRERERETDVWELCLFDEVTEAI